MTTFGGTTKTRDHVIPLSRGGVNGKKNIVICCKDCNELKGSRVLQNLINKVERFIVLEKKGKVKTRGARIYSLDEMEQIIASARLLVDNCLNVYGASLFGSQYDYEAYMEEMASYKNNSKVFI